MAFRCECSCQVEASVNVIHPNPLCAISPPTFYVKTTRISIHGCEDFSLVIPTLRHFLARSFCQCLGLCAVGVTVAFCSKLAPETVTRNRAELFHIRL
jgi:hypothetical protein